jgi:tetratricopeptide (TPR) repeat protein
MAIRIEVPSAEVAFPQKCASCGNPEVQKTMPIRHLTQAAQGRQSTGYLIGGLIGAAIAGATAGADKYVQFGIPYCQDCATKDRNLKITAWLCLAAGLLSIIILPIVAASMTSSDSSGSLIAVGVFLGLALLIAALVLFVVQSSGRAVRIMAVKDYVRGAVLSFRNPQYLEDFRQLNMRSLVPYALRAGLPLPVHPEQAIALISESIVEDKPDLPATLSGHFYRGQIYMQMQFYGQAADELSKVIVVGGYNPFVPDAYFLRGQAYMYLSRYAEAASDLDTFIRSSPDKRRVGEAKRLLKQVSPYSQR